MTAKVQDYRSTYNDIRQWRRKEVKDNSLRRARLKWGDVVRWICSSLKRLALDYILALVFEKNKETHTKEELIEDVRRVIRAAWAIEPKESLIIDYIHATDLDNMSDRRGDRLLF